MSEQATIPAPMLDAAETAVTKLSYRRDTLSLREVLEIGFEAAGVAALVQRVAELERQLHNAKTGEGCPHGCVRPSQCVDCIQERNG